MEKPPYLPQKRVHYRDFWFRLIFALVAAHWVVSFGEPETIFELWLMGDYWRSLAGSGIIAFGLISLIRWISIRLDRTLDWQERPGLRGLTQAAVGIGLLAMIAYMAAAVYFALHGIDIRDTVYLSLDWPLIVAMLIMANLFYLLYFIAVMWRQEKREPPKSDSYKEVIIVQVAAKNIPIRVVDIAYFFRLNDENFLRTNDGSDYLIPDALDRIESLMDPDLFFRANRQFLVRFQAC